MLPEAIGITDQLLYSTVRITATSDGGASHGTGFFYRVPHPTDSALGATLIITNKHVVRGAHTISFFVHIVSTQEEYRPTGNLREVSLPWNEWSIVDHPEPNVDLCGIFFSPVSNQLRTGENLRAFYRSIDAKHIPSKERLANLKAIEDIIMVGYPIGLWDDKNNFPLFRRGITSTHPAVDFKGQPISVIDAACFPGSSGSPVFFLRQGMYVDKRGGTNVGGQEILLLGVLFAGPQMTAKGIVEIEEVPTQQVSVSKIPMMIHLGFIVQAREILAIEAIASSMLRNSGQP